MNRAQLLDCTLRDGAYLIDKTFGETAINGIVRGLIKAKVDYIELGFLQDEGFGEGKVVFRNSADASGFIPKEKGNAEFALLADYSRYSIENLDARSEGSVDVVRECFFKEERYGAMECCRRIKELGYKVFVQPVDILGYSDRELLELIELVNEVEPYCMSIVDTFGSMYEEDLQHIYSIIDHNLVSTAKIGFHSHNNMQLSNALSQAFLRMANGKRQVVVDGTLAGMGRGAGNTPTELIAQYMVAKLGYSYDMDALLDVMDGYMDNLRSRCSCGYSTPYFIAGCFSAHVNNIAHLIRKKSIRFKDIRYILNKIGAQARKRYEYKLLDDTYMECLQSNIDDTQTIGKLREELAGRTVVVIAPGKTASDCSAEISAYIREHNAAVITVNFIHDSIAADYVYMSNVRRYDHWRNADAFLSARKIVTSNVSAESDDRMMVVSFARLVKCGWEHLDNSTVMLLRLLDLLGVGEICMAGFDGYSNQGDKNYASPYLELSNVKVNPMELNDEIRSMLEDYRKTRTNPIPVRFITPSRFAETLEG